MINLAFIKRQVKRKWTNNTNQKKSKHMNKKTLLSLMMLLLASIGVARAQEVTVYDGTSTSRNVPAYVYFFDDFTRS